MQTEITKEELKFLYDTKRPKEVAELLEITKPTLLKLLRDHGIPIKHQGAQRKVIVRG
jgi:excisionase family DNA binding protein